MYAYGGALTQYSRSYGNSSCGGLEIRVLDYQEAIVWAQEKLSCDEYEEIFGEVDEDDCTKRVQITLPAKAYGICNKITLSKETTIGQVLEELVLEINTNQHL